MKEYIERTTILNLLGKINPVDFGSMFDYEAHSAVQECICPAKALLNHIHVENVDLTEIHAAQRESAYCLVAIRFSSTLIVNLL